MNPNDSFHIFSPLDSKQSGVGFLGRSNGEAQDSNSKQSTFFSHPSTTDRCRCFQVSLCSAPARGFSAASERDFLRLGRYALSHQLDSKASEGRGTTLMHRYIEWYILYVFGRGARWFNVFNTHLMSWKSMKKYTLWRNFAHSNE